MSTFTHQSTLVRTKRIQKLLSQKHMGSVIGSISGDGQGWSNIERGKCGLPLKHFKSVSEALEIPLEDLVDAHLKDHIDHMRKTLWKQYRPELAHVRPTNEFLPLVASEVLDGAM